MRHLRGLILCALLVPAAVAADIRLMMRFDDGGHFIHQRFNITSNVQIPRHSQLDTIIAEALYDRPGVAWFDQGGNVIEYNEIADPRLAHAPMSTKAEWPLHRSMRRQSGVYLLRGPDAARSFAVILPTVDFDDVSLPAERFDFVLEPG